jgi:hypothetical protein
MFDMATLIRYRTLDLIEIKRGLSARLIQLNMAFAGIVKLKFVGILPGGLHG